MKKRYVYLNGTLYPVGSPLIPIPTHAFNYGTAAFEGMRTYYRQDIKTWVLFRPDRYFQRLKKSTALLGIDFSMSDKEFIDIIALLLKKNNIRHDLYIRPIVYHHAQGVGLSKTSGYSVAMYLDNISTIPLRALTACYVSQRRPTDGSYAGKITGNYVLSYLAYQEAMSKGYDSGILLSSDGYISEAWAMNLFFVENEKLFTPSLACGALAGVTRDSIIQIARNSLKLRVYEGKYRPKRLQSADEIILVGTGAGINSIKKLEKRTLPKKKNPLVKVLWHKYSSYIRGNLPDEFGWIIPI